MVAVKLGVSGNGLSGAFLTAPGLGIQQNCIFSLGHFGAGNDRFLNGQETAFRHQLLSSCATSPRGLFLSAPGERPRSFVALPARAWHAGAILYQDRQLEPGSSSRSSRPAEQLEKPLLPARWIDESALIFSREEVLQLAHDLRALSVVDFQSQGLEEKRFSHPEVTGVEIFHGDPLFHDGEPQPGKARWLLDIPSPVIMLSPMTRVSIEVEAMPTDVIVRRELSYGETAAFVVGEDAAGNIRVEGKGLSLRSVLHLMQERGVKPREIVIVRGDDPDVEEASDDLAEYGLPVRIFRGDALALGAHGYSVIGVEGMESFAWTAGATEALAATERPIGGGASEVPAMLKAAVTSLLQEVARQLGMLQITPHRLQRIMDRMSGDARVGLLVERFQALTPDERSQQHDFWLQAFLLFAAPLVLREVDGFAVDADARVQRYRAAYYAFSQIARQAQPYQRYRVEEFFDQRFEELLKAQLLDVEEKRFLREMLIPACHTRGQYDGLGDHDVYTCVSGFFFQRSAFPFRFLEGRIDLLSLVGGYGQRTMRAVMNLLEKKGWDDFIVAEYQRGEGRRYEQAVAVYENAAELVDRFDFGTIGALLGERSEAGGKPILALEAAKKLLPAVAHLITSRADLEVGQPNALLRRLLERYHRLQSSAPEATSCLHSLSRHLHDEWELDPELRGTLAQRLAVLEEKARTRGVDRKGLFLFAIPGLAHLISSADDLDADRPGTLGDVLIEHGDRLGEVIGLDQLIGWNDLFPLLPFVRSAAELGDIIEALDYWNGRRANFQELLKLVRAAGEGRSGNSGLDPDDLGRLAVELLLARKPTYTTFLQTALESGTFGNERHGGMRRLLTDKRFDIHLRLNALGDYTELLQVDAMLEPKRLRSRSLNSGQAVRGVKPLLEMHQKTLDEVNTLFQGIMHEMDLKKIRRSRLHALMAQRMKPLRAALMQEVLGRELMSRERQLLSNNRNYPRMLRLMSLAFTIESGSGFQEGALARRFLREASEVFLSKLGEGERAASDEAVTAVRNWSLTLNRDKIAKLMADAYPNELEDARTRRMEHVRGNSETKDRLIDAGYDAALWDKGIDLELKLSDGLTEKERRAQILTATFELAEIALSIGMRDPDGTPLRLSVADQLDSSRAAEAFIMRMRRTMHLSEELLERCRHILETVRDLEGQRVISDVPSTTVRATIRKDLFAEASAGVGVPGCFNPRGIHREMPFVHAAEASSGFLQVFSARRDQMANAVVLFGEDGAYVYGGYNSSAYNMDPVFGEALKQLSRLVPKIFLSSFSAGIATLKPYAVRERQKLTFPAPIFKDRYFDTGAYLKDGTLTLEEDFYVVTEASIEAGGGFVERALVAEPASEVPQLDWQKLADKFINPDREAYPFLERIPEPKALLRLIGLLKQRFHAEGWRAADERLYESIGAIVRQKLGAVDQDVADGVADLVIDFFEEASWPLENATAPRPRG